MRSRLGENSLLQLMTLRHAGSGETVTVSKVGIRKSPLFIHGRQNVLHKFVWRKPPDLWNTLVLDSTGLKKPDLVTEVSS